MPARSGTPISLSTYPKALRLYRNEHYESSFRGTHTANITNLPTLSQGREQLCKQYFKKLLKEKESHKLHKLLPSVRQIPCEIRSINKHPLVNARTSRYFNTFIPWASIFLFFVLRPLRHFKDWPDIKLKYLLSIFLFPMGRFIFPNSTKWRTFSIKHVKKCKMSILF